MKNKPSVCCVRRLSVPGCELTGIHYLRTLGNSEAIREDASGKRVVLIGGSYIATEVAASLTEMFAPLIVKRRGVSGHQAAAAGYEPAQRLALSLR